MVPMCGLIPKEAQKKKGQTFLFCSIMLLEQHDSSKSRHSWKNLSDGVHFTVLSLELFSSVLPLKVNIVRLCES